VVFDGAESGVIAAFEAALERLNKAGAVVRRLEVPIFSEIFQMMAERGPLIAAEAYVLHNKRLSGPEAADMDRRVVARTMLGAKISLIDYVETLNTRERMIAEMADLLLPGEIIAFPTVAHVAPKVAPLLESDDAFFAMNGKTLRNTTIGNFLDWCGVSIPCGTGEASMPVGLLLSGLPGTDEHLLEVALAAEDVVRG
jgi:aspartyl-tRNA(Asn)/glutamyl-tRNA(Gln) amidotransferase subunit A